MSQSRLGLFSLALAGLIAALTGVSALLQRGPAPDPEPSDAVVAMARGPRLGGGNAPANVAPANVAEDAVEVITAKAAVPAMASLTVEPAPYTRITERPERPVAPPAPYGAGPAETEPQPQSQPALMTVQPPSDPKPTAYRPHPRLWERPVSNPARPERPTPLRARLTPAERDLLAHLIYAEAAGEPYEGKVAVAAVVLNRLAHPQFPNTVEGVVFEPGAFEPVRNGRLWRGVSERSYRALDDALRGWDPTNGALYFYNPKLVSPNNWIRTRRVVRVIGQHYFAI